MYCENCGAELTAQTNFCPYCGSRLQAATASISLLNKAVSTAQSANEYNLVLISREAAMPLLPEICSRMSLAIRMPNRETL